MSERERDEWMGTDDAGRPVDLRKCPCCEKPRLMFAMRNMGDQAWVKHPAQWRVAYDAEGKCCNPKCNGQWGTNCWHCHSPRYSSAEEIREALKQKDLDRFRLAGGTPIDEGSPRVILGKESSGTLRVVYHNDGTVLREFTGGSEGFTIEPRPCTEIVTSTHIQNLVGVGVKYTTEEVQAAAHHAPTKPCPGCAHTEHPGQYWGAQEAETCGTCGGSAVV